MKIRFKKGLLNNPLTLLILLFPFYPINAIKGANIQNGLVVIEAGCLLLVWLKIRKVTAPLIWVLLFTSILMISTFLNHTSNLWYAMFYGLRMAAFFLLIELCFLLSEELTVLKVMDGYISVLLAVNLFFQVFLQDYWGYTEAMNYANFFVGDNQLPFYIIPYIFIIMLRVIIFGEKKYALIKIAVAYLNLIEAWCVGGIIAATACFILIALSFNSGFRRLFRYKKMVLAIILIYCFCLFLREFEFLDRITMSIFGKVLSNARSNIWKAAIENIKNRFWIGYGTARGGRMSINYVNSFKHWYSHNFILEYFIQGGIFLFGVYMLGIWSIGKKMKGMKENILPVIWVVVFFSMHLAYLTEGTIAEPTQYILFLLGYHMKDLIEFKPYRHCKER